MIQGAFSVKLLHLFAAQTCKVVSLHCNKVGVAAFCCIYPNRIQLLGHFLGIG